jgi:hypothetical protein
MRFELKPLTFGEVLDGSFKILRSNLGLFFGIAVAFDGPLLVASALMGASQAQLAAGKHPPAGPVLLGVLVILAASLLLWGTMTAAAVQVVSGETTSLGKALKRFLGVLEPAIGATILMFLIGTLCTLALIIPGIIYFLGRVLYLPVLLVERGSGSGSLKRSKQLVKGRLDRVFGIGLLFGVVSWALRWGVGMLIPAGLKVTFVGMLVGLLPQLVAAPLYPIAIVLIYFDARIRDEGYDLELRAKEAGSVAGAA